MSKTRKERKRERKRESLGDISIIWKGSRTSKAKEERECET